MFCPHCGNQYAVQQRFCTHCGGAMAATPPAGAAGLPMAAAAAAAAEHEHKSLVGGVSSRINRLAGTEKLEGFSLKEMFSQVFKKRTPEEVEDYLIAGTLKTTPNITDVQTGWPHPWLFARVLGLLVLAYFGLVMGWNQFQNTNFIPGIMLLGDFAVPLAMVVLFYELNTPRNVSLPKLAQLFLTGAVLSLFIAMIGYTDIGGALKWMGDSQAGIVEELAKLAAVILIARSIRYKYILNGLLVGATVGAGFAAFESAGYAFTAVFQTHNANFMLQEIQMRAMWAPFGHIAWTAIAAAALWRAKGEAAFHLGVLKNGAFWRTMLIPMGLHALWDFYPQWPVFVAAGVVGYFVIFGLVQQGLHQVRDDQKWQLSEQLSQLQAAPAGLTAAAGSGAEGA